MQVIKMLRPQLDDDEAGCIFQSLGRLANLKVPHVQCECHVFSPPCEKCIMCHNDLVKYNEPVVVDYFHLLGKSKGIKVSLKCNRCDVFYGYSKYGNPNSGWKLYHTARDAVEASDVCFVERTLLKWQTSLACHCWVSFSGFSVAFNQVHDLITGYGEKQAASAFFNGEMESELRDLGTVDFFGLLKTDGDRERVMEQIDILRAKTLYSHSAEDCSDACKDRGCGTLWVVDGQWKLMFAHCMMQRKNFVKGLPLLNYPNVCTASPKYGKAFCDEHLQYLTRNHPNIPTDLRGFLAYCGIQRSEAEIGEHANENMSGQEVTKVDAVLSSFHHDELSQLGNSAVMCQGNTEFIETEYDAMSNVLSECTEPRPTSCNKDTGAKQRLQKWSRGHLFIVRGGGIIDKWNPLFKSESPSQVFMIVLSWLFVILKSLNPANWSKIFVAYDNMCHLDGLRAAKNLLPLPSPWDKAWISVNKIIDKLHIKNHKDNTCKEKYNPSGLKEEMPGANTMAAEQTFVWLSRFKKILCPMPKIHHLFYLHRMVKHRNRYTVHCYKNNKKPLLPKARGMQN